ncbi:hypothetical protein CBU02nite_07470 [Clostridium butyricum]|uniref:Uncharacterized protein n=1 Tax=Clostridium butyricum TaxID=1492 RepID=A0A512TJG8_CLOBU|nr:ABC-three component system middle component 1 [Clostridium butyricum]MCQ2013500.1 hypothetical protein [Clostridium butyricum]MCQ2025717.1 hypothetical protein [Clostridium butyricum]NOW22350.1 hypothetical protein [Clostridium butyricum]GEQ20241.1 hypothetical protein CBU02nite_07470 [Clostridium butyricum]
MKDIIKLLFEDSEYEVKDFKWGQRDTLTFINKNDETYVIYFANLSKDLVDDVFNLCSEDIYKSSNLERANKSNLSIIIIPNIENEILSDVEINIIFQIEENELFFKKFVLWYTHEELDDLKEICNNSFDYKSLEEQLLNYDRFNAFKNNNTNQKGYNLLSRLFIKLPFLTLLNVEKYSKKLTELIDSNLIEISSQLNVEVLEGRDVKSLLTLVPFKQEEIDEIDKQIEKLIMEQEKNNE